MEADVLDAQFEPKQHRIGTLAWIASTVELCPLYKSLILNLLEKFLPDAPVLERNP